MYSYPTNLLNVYVSGSYPRPTSDIKMGSEFLAGREKIRAIRHNYGTMLFVLIMYSSVSF